MQLPNPISVEFVGKYELKREDEPISPYIESPPNEANTFSGGKIEPD